MQVVLLALLAELELGALKVHKEEQVQLVFQVKKENQARVLGKMEQQEHLVSEVYLVVQVLREIEVFPVMLVQKAGKESLAHLE